jgi:hypothetical protein
MHQTSQVYTRSKRPGYGSGAYGSSSPVKSTGLGSDGNGVHVQMETFTRAEEGFGDENLSVVGGVGGGKKLVLTLDTGKTVVLGGDDNSKGRVYAG